MNGKILLATLVVAGLIMFATPAMAQCGGCGGCGGAVYGVPQDCVATVSCNIPVTQNVPYVTCTTVPQPVQVPVTVPVQSSVTVPTAVIVPQQVPVTTYATSCVTQSVPVQVPVTAYQPVTSYVPQVYTIPLGCGAGGCGANAPAGGLSKGLSKASANTPMTGGMSKAANDGGMSKGGFSK